MLKHRFMSGFVIVSVTILITNHLPPVGTWLVIVALSSLSQLEFYTMANKAGIPVFRVYGLLCGAAMISATFCTIGPEQEHLARGHIWENAVLLVSMMVIFVRQFPQKHNDKPLSTIACTILGIFYVPFLLNYFTRLCYGWSSADSSIHVSHTGRMLVLYLVLVVKITDVGAFFTGKAFGHHKLFPRISPKKTWEGLIGGIVVAVLASWLFSHFTQGKLGDLPLGSCDAVILGVLLSVIGVVGDLFESLLKRAANVKDSGVAVPGMGGILDVLDSLLFTAPVLYVYARFFLS